MKNIIFCFFLIANLFSLACFAQEPRFNHIVFLGDSLTDNGNFYRSTLGAFPKSPPYYQGRFSNGKTWAEDVADFYLQKFDYKSENYAVGGETVLFHNPLEGYLPYTLSMSIDSYLFNNLFKDKSKTIYFIWIGANDYLPEKTYNEKLVTDVINDIAQQVEKLIQNGGKNFFIFNLPDMGKTPKGRETDKSDLLTNYTNQHNKFLQEAILRLEAKYSKVNFEYFNVNSLFKDVVAHPENYNKKYGAHLVDTEHACWSGGYTLKNNTAENLQNEINLKIPHRAAIDTAQLSRAIVNSPSLNEAYQLEKSFESGEKPCEHPEQFLFWDKVHASAETHALLAKIFVEFLL